MCFTHYYGLFCVKLHSVHMFVLYKFTSFVYSDIPFYTFLRYTFLLIAKQIFFGPGHLTLDQMYRVFCKVMPALAFGNKSKMISCCSIDFC